MHINIPSRFNHKSYLETEISVEDGCIDVLNIFSPLSKTNDYYNKNVKSEFDFSFFDEYGFHSVIGNENQHVKNLLVLVAYEQTFYNREVNFKFSNDILNHFISSDDFYNQILDDTTKTLAQLNLIPKNDFFWKEFTVWIYFKFQNILLKNEVNKSIVVKFIDSILFDKNFIEISKVIYQIDSNFLAVYSSKSYQDLRKLLTSDKVERDNVIILASYKNNLRQQNSANDDFWKQAARRDINSRNGNLSETVNRQLTNILNNNICNPEPKYLPIIEGRKPENVAQQILKYYDYSLPDLETVLNDLGTVLIKHSLGGNFLGLFISNPNAHQSAIVVDIFQRNEGSHNFTIAHELGHYLLHNNKSLLLCGEQEIYYPENNQNIEQEANAFSIEMLMPIQNIRDDIKGNFTAQNIRNIANKCNVSMEAAARRRIQLDKNRRLAFISVVDNKIVSRAATKIKDDGTLWIGQRSIGINAVSLEQAIILNNQKEPKLSQYLPLAVEDWLQNLEINIYPFVGLNGYYMFIEFNG